MNVILYGKRVFANATKLKILSWRDHSGLCGWALSPVTGVLIRKRQRETGDRRETYGREDAMKTEETVMMWHQAKEVQRMPTASRCWKKQWTDSPPEPLGGVQPDLRLGLQYCERTHLSLASSHMFVVICSSNHRKWIYRACISIHQWWEWITFALRSL